MRHFGEWITKALAWIGGISGIIKLLEFLSNKLKLIGEVLRVHIGSEIGNSDESTLNAIVTLQVHVVNKRGCNFLSVNSI